MARPPKNGFDNFPLDAQFNDQVQALAMLHGPAGGWWIIRAWQRCYQNGSAILDLRGAFEVTTATAANIDVALQKEIVQTAMKVGLLAQKEPGLFVMNGVIKRIEWMLGERASTAKRVRKLRAKIVMRNNEINSQDTPQKDDVENDDFSNNVTSTGLINTVTGPNPAQKEDVTRYNGGCNAVVTKCNAEKKRKRKEKEKEKSEPWQLSLTIYISQANEALQTLLTDHAWIREREEFHPNIDIQKSLRKAWVDFWATEEGWKYKLAHTSGKIDWKKTAQNALSFSSNQVKKEYRTYQQPTKPNLPVLK